MLRAAKRESKKASKKAFKWVKLVNDFNKKRGLLQVRGSIEIRSSLWCFKSEFEC